MFIPWKESYDQLREHIEKQRHYFANKGSFGQSYGFSSGHVWMWELDYKESWAPKNWCFWTVVLEKTFRVPWSSRRSNQSILKEISTEYSLEGLMLKLKLQYLANWYEELTHQKRPYYWERLKAGGEEGEMVRWHHWLYGHEFEQVPGVGEGQRSLACSSPWGCKESDMTEWLNWTEHTP